MRIGIGAKLHTIMAAALVGIVTVSGVGFASLKTQVEQDRMTKTRNLVDTAYGVAPFFEGEALAGHLQPRMVAHPMKPELEGKDRSAVQAPAGKRPFVDVVARVKQQGRGFFDDLWPTPEADVPVPKRSFVRGFAPWGWVIGTGIYADDIAAMLWAAASKVAAGMLVVVALIGLLAASIGRRVTRPLLAPNQAMHRLAAGETDAPAPARDRPMDLYFRSKRRVFTHRNARSKPVFRSLPC